MTTLPGEDRPTGSDRAGLAGRLWRSPTLSTWLSQAIRVLNMGLVLPLALARLEPAEVALWQLLLGMAALLRVGEMAVSATFVRLIGHAEGRAARSERAGAAPAGEGAGVLGTLEWAARRVMLWEVVVGGVAGSWLLLPAVRMVPSSREGWVAWGLTLLGVGASARWCTYATFAQGIDEVARVRRVEAVVQGATALATALAIALGARLLGIVTLQVLGQVASCWAFRRLALRLGWSARRADAASGADPAVVAQAAPSIWRSALGMAMALGVLQLSGFFYARFVDAASLASYLLGIRLLSAVTEASRAPFYSRLPLYSRWLAEGRRDDLLAAARTSMALAHWVFLAGFAILGLLAPAGLRLVGAATAFPDQRLWVTLGLAFWLERYGAMHLQLYSTTNHIVWHVANGITGVVTLVGFALIGGRLGVIGFPIAYLIGQLACYAWYGPWLAYRAFSIRVWWFERAAALPAFAAFVAVCVLLLRRR